MSPMTHLTTDALPDDPWAEIRPYRDDEVAEVLARLAHDPELLDALTRFRLPRLSRFMPSLSRTLASLAIRREVRGVASVQDFQMRIASYMERMIRTTTDDFRVEGLDALDGDTAYLFIGNHRDISLDPAFVNYALYQAGRNTVRIAIGDNLLKKPYVTDLMRLNKSFIVPRSARGKRAMLAAYQQRTGTRRHSIPVRNHSTCIAQRERRAKDGIDRTDPAIIKMMTMARRAEQRGVGIGEAIAELRLVPVSTLHDSVPCVVQRARELLVGGQHGALPPGAAQHDEALVEPHQVGDVGLLEQVVADGDAHRVAAGLVEGVVDEGRVQGDVPVVADEEVGGIAVQGVEPLDPEVIGGSADHALHVGGDAHLEVLDAGHAAHLAADGEAGEGP